MAMGCLWLSRPGKTCSQRLVTPMQRPEQLHRLPGKWGGMGFALFGPLGRYSPEGSVEDEFGPTRLHCLARTAQRQPHQAKGGEGFVAAAMAGPIAQQLADLVHFKRTFVLFLVGWQRTMNGVDRVAFCPKCGHRQVEYARHRSFRLGCHARAVLACDGCEYVQHRHRCDLPDRLRADLAEHHALQPVEAALLRHRIPVLHRQPSGGHGLEIGRAILVAAQAGKLAFAGHIDTWRTCFPWSPPAHSA